MQSDESAPNNSPEVKEIIRALQLEPHVEGGYFRRTFEAGHREPVQTLRGPRLSLTSIYYLLSKDSPIGHWHLNESDIIHYFHLGSPVRYFLIHPDGEMETVDMGSDLAGGQQLQLAVRGGTWKASQLLSGEYGLISEAVAPGFDFADMQLGKKGELLSQFPQHATWIEAFSSR